MIALVISALTLGAPEGIDADEAVRRALANAPALASERLDIDRQRAVASSITLKSLKLGLEHRAVQYLGHGPFYDDGTVYSPWDRTYVELGWTPPELDEMGLDQSIAGALADAGAESIASSERSLAADVRLLHAHILVLREERALVRDALAMDERMRDAITQKLQAEAATQLDASLAELDVLDIQLDLDEVDSSLAHAEARLARLTGATTGSLSLSGDVPACQAPPDAATVLARVREVSPRLRALALRRTSLDRESIKSTLRYVPWISRIKAGYLNEQVSRDDQWRAGVDIDIPVFAFLEGSGTDLDLRRARLDAEAREIDDDIASDVATAVERLRTAATLVEKHAHATNDVTTRSTAAIDEALASGHADMINAASVHQRALKSRRAHLRARERCVEATVELMRLTGDVLPK